MYLGVGLAPNKPALIQVLINEDAVFTLKTSAQSRQFDLVSRTMLLNLNKNDKIKLRNEKVLGFKSDFFTTSIILYCFLFPLNHLKSIMNNLQILVYLNLNSC